LPCFPVKQAKVDLFAMLDSGKPIPSQRWSAKRWGWSGVPPVKESGIAMPESLLAEQKAREGA
jgi:hypothetical protein